MKKSDAITIKDIARALGLSHSTVARALKGSYKISEETKRVVLAYAEEHNYRPNLFAQSLKNKQSRGIGVMIPAVPNNFFAEVIDGIEAEASAQNYHIIISQTQESYEKELKNLEHLLWRSVDGLLVSLSTETKDPAHFEALKRKGIPVVFFDRVPENLDTYKVVADNYRGSYELTRHLIASGFTRIAQITSSPHISITRERQKGYEEALMENGFVVNHDYIRYCLHGGKETSEMIQALDELLHLPQPPDALITCSDRLTIGCFSLLKARGIDIPRQMALAGFSNFHAPELFCPSLTTVVQPAFDMGRTAMHLLLQLIESKRPVQPFENIVLPVQLFTRASTKK